MFKHYFEQIQNIEIWPIISLIIFFVFFTFTLIRIFFLDKGYLHPLSRYYMLFCFTVLYVYHRRCAGDAG